VDDERAVVAVTLSKIGSAQGTVHPIPPTIVSQIHSATEQCCTCCFGKSVATDGTTAAKASTANAIAFMILPLFEECNNHNTSSRGRHLVIRAIVKLGPIDRQVKRRSILGDEE
jgi:hypothetical protein